MVGRRKLPDHSLNWVFNALSLGVQYTLSFQWTVFGLECQFLEILQNSQENTFARASFLKPYLKRDSGKGVFMWISRNFSDIFSCRTPPVPFSIYLKNVNNHLDFSNIKCINWSLKSLNMSFVIRSFVWEVPQFLSVAKTAQGFIFILIAFIAAKTWIF